MDIVLVFLWYWDMHNGSVFDGWHELREYMQKLVQGAIMCQIILLEYVEILFSIKCFSCLLAIQHVPLPM